MHIYEHLSSQLNPLAGNSCLNFDSRRREIATAKLISRLGKQPAGKRFREQHAARQTLKTRVLHAVTPINLSKCSEVHGG